MKPRRYILDTTLRDGEQAPGLCFTPEQKIKIAGLLDAAGVYQIEAGAPYISNEEKQCIKNIIENRRHALISAWARLDPGDIEHCADIRPDIIHISIPVSYTHIYVKLRKNKAWLLNTLKACVLQAQQSGITVSAGLEDAFRSDASFVTTVTRALLDLDVTRIRLCDTVGTAAPSVCRAALKDLAANTDERAQFGFHGHNDLGLALANTIEAMKYGCLYADVTIGGIGERAGNCDLMRLISASAGIFDWGITKARALELHNDVFSVIS